MIPRLVLYDSSQKLVMEAFGGELIPEGLAILGYYATEQVEPQDLYFKGQKFKLTETLKEGLWAEGLPVGELHHPIVLEKS